MLPTETIEIIMKIVLLIYHICVVPIYIFWLKLWKPKQVNID